ncbi:LysR family transcriptional regulator [Loktanella sp. Alg231-35]|uniref:LysR family transcriptional regulator n=1 Tax=Loktanella sp. Alg231-35 TaxID=1922220 RepID=UPI000D555C2E|nr:LysR family transcriptional regulator [Loktanella sp. Alg231-35]
MNWRNIPSLAALRAFEAVARRGSFTAAAAELNVTHAAIAQHVRAIEAELNTSLLVREGRGMAMTEAGAALGAALFDGFSLIIDGVQAVTADAETRPIALSVTPSFAENWLMPRFADFWAKHPDFGLSINPNVTVIDLRRDGIDLAVRYGKGDWAGLEATFLLPADFTVVAAPSLLQGREIKSFEDLDGLPWIFETVHKEARRWVLDSGIDVSKSPVNDVPTFGMVMAAVRAGKALSVASSALVATDFNDGKLVRLMQRQPKGLGYYIVHPKGVLSTKARILKSWLLAAAKA